MSLRIAYRPFQIISRFYIKNAPLSIRRSLHYTSFLHQVQPTIAFPPIQQKLLSLKPIKPNDTQISCTVFNEKGNVIAVSQNFQKWKFLRDHDLFPRDLRKIDTSSVDVIPNILVKPSCIVVNLLHIKALIEKDRVYVFDTSDPSFAVKLGVLMYDLESKLGNNSIAYKQSYEHNALESIFINVMSTLETEYKQHEYICTKILNDLENQINREKLRDLLIKSKDLTLFYQRSFLIRDVFDELLESDEDMAAMYLSGKKYKPSSKTTHIHHHEQINDLIDPQDTELEEEVDITDIEMLLETYYTQCDEYVQHAESLIQDIKSTEEIVNIILDANRNSLMVLELKVTIYTLGFTVASLLPAFYGMNLKNFIEESYLGFAGVVVFSAVLAMLITKVNFRALKSVTKVAMSHSSNDTTVPDLIQSQIPNHVVNPAMSKMSDIPEVNQTTPSQPRLHKLKPPETNNYWFRFKNSLGSLWQGKSFQKRDNNNIWTKEEKDMVWKWLTKGDKKDE